MPKLTLAFPVLGAFPPPVINQRSKTVSFVPSNCKSFRRDVSEMCKQAKIIAPKIIVTFSYAFYNVSPALL